MNGDILKYQYLFKRVVVTYLKTMLRFIIDYEVQIDKASTSVQQERRMLFKCFLDEGEVIEKPMAIAQQYMDIVHGIKPSYMINVL